MRWGGGTVVGALLVVALVHPSTSTVNQIRGLVGRVQGLKQSKLNRVRALLPSLPSLPGQTSWSSGGGRRPSYNAPKPSYKQAPPPRPSYKQQAPGPRPSYKQQAPPRRPSKRPPSGRPSSPSYGNALAPPISGSSSSSPSSSYSANLSDEQMLELVREMHSMMKVIMENSQRLPTTQYSSTPLGSQYSLSSSASSGSNTFSSPSSSSSSTYSSPSSSASSPILSSGFSSTSSVSSSSRAPDSYGTPLGQPIITSNAALPPILSPRPPTTPAPAVPAPSSYGSALAPPLSSSTSFSTPQSPSSDPLVNAASSLPQAQYETELATLDAVIEMLSTYQEEQARRRRKLEHKKSGVEEITKVEERHGEEKESYKPLRFPESPTTTRARSILAVLQNRRMDDLLDSDLSDLQFQKILQQAGLWDAEVTEDLVSDSKSGPHNDPSVSELRVDQFF